MNSNRRGEAQSTLNAVRARHEAIQNIERTMIELAELFQDLDTIVMQQDEAIQQIQEKAEEAQTNIIEANKELDQGIVSARGARKKKWICLCLTILILVLIAAGLAAYFLINKKPAPEAPAQVTVTATPARR